MVSTAGDDSADDVYSGMASGAEKDRARDLLRQHGFAPLKLAIDGRPHGGAALLVEHLRSVRVPPRGELVERITTYAHRPRPHLADEDIFAVPFTSGDVLEKAWIDPRRILLKRPGTESFIHNQSWTGVDSIIESVAEMAERIAGERGSPRGLDTLFGPHPANGIAVEGWEVGDYGYVFAINDNGNHRLAALAALGVPCVLAEVRIKTGPFRAEKPDAPGDYADPASDAVTHYRRLLHTFGVASIPDAGSSLADRNITTRWPFVLYDPDTAAASLAAMEQLTGSTTATIGDLPREWFDNPSDLREIGAQLDRVLTRFLAVAEDYVHPGTGLPEPPPRRRWWPPKRPR